MSSLRTILRVPTSVGLVTFLLAFLAVVMPLDAVYELLDGGDVDVGIARGLGIFAAAGVTLWLVSALVEGVAATRVRSRQRAAGRAGAIVVPADRDAGDREPLGSRLRRRQRGLLRGAWAAVGLNPRMTVDGAGITLLRAVAEVTRHGMLETLRPTVTVRHGDHRYAFRCTDHAEFVRVYTMLERETGTVGWLCDELRPDDVLYDIGANIGAFTLLAASRTPRGAVYAFEPHLGNAASLLANVGLNGRRDVVRVLSCPLSDRVGAFRFEYDDLEAGTAFSHLGERAGSPDPGSDHGFELKLATTVDQLLSDGAIAPANLVKLDVDGQELEVLRGMHGLLTGPDRPRAIQVEVNPQERGALHELMASCGYRVDSQHLSAGAAKRAAAGESEAALASNAIFRPAS